MKKFYSLVMASLCSVGATVAAQTPNYPGGDLQRELTIKPTLEYAEATPAPAQAEAATDAAGAPSQS